MPIDSKPRQSRLSIFVGGATILICGFAFALSSHVGTLMLNTPAIVPSAGPESPHAPLEPALRSLDGVTAHG